ncbi:hypothetical protein [Burkholderia anthina]|uniref:hypothetical protein n=1 Tax=Burkholderia anthina TaxID=179879 RepID=UPI000B26C158|nr:hypothetical protein [Burkholderia anthina]
MSVQDEVLRAWREAAQKGQIGEYEQLDIGGPEKLVVLPHDALAKLQRELDEVKLQQSIDWFQAQGLMDELQSPEPDEAQQAEQRDTQVFGKRRILKPGRPYRDLLIPYASTLAAAGGVDYFTILKCNLRGKFPTKEEAAEVAKKLSATKITILGHKAGNPPIPKNPASTAGGLRAHTQKNPRRKSRSEG